MTTVPCRCGRVECRFDKVLTAYGARRAWAPGCSVYAALLAQKNRESARIHKERKRVSGGARICRCGCGRPMVDTVRGQEYANECPNRAPKAAAAKRRAARAEVSKKPCGVCFDLPWHRPKHRPCMCGELHAEEAPLSILDFTQRTDAEAGFHRGSTSR